MTTVADNGSNVEARLGGVEAQFSSLADRVAYLEGRLEVAQSLQGIRESFRLTTLAIWLLAGITFVGMSAIAAVLVAIALMI